MISRPLRLQAPRVLPMVTTVDITDIMVTITHPHNHQREAPVALADSVVPVDLVV
jgi:hypothetical protein